ncbi:pilus assembly PilX family protein [Neisseria wadsworthii]|uniref:Type IV pilus assembly protein PilX n=1 Tax=Neisseria wadsworthii 9715 TaxID=1030841 RepID=G4CQB5_9NEIS|nr:PilX N-terminal domain-containing pilus assembly protein [Neisseria wadsworthii]EGZ46520.1 type IV pilus assembly protein PilX [Neisseria wadsworthii 9715]QMT35035.1 pilus assembly protein PilX [Neisseria wadsworthii]
MRKPLIMALPEKQKGFSLFIVLIMMLVIAFLVVAATQSYNTEMRISSNDADRKSAFTIAEAALRQGEEDIASFTDVTFSANCNNGLCAYSGQKEKSTITTAVGTITLEACRKDCENINAWERKDNKDKPYLETNGRQYSIAKDSASKAARYIIEATGSSTQPDGGIRVIYRVTSRAWGKNPNTSVTLQSYVEGTYNAN